MTYPLIPAGRPPRTPTAKDQFRQLRNQVAEMSRQNSPTPNPGGEWRSTSSAVLAITTNTLFTAWDTVVETPVGISLSGGIFTVGQAGLWTIDSGTRVTGATQLYWWICPGATVNNAWRKSSTSANNASVAHTKRLNAGDTFAIAYWASGTSPHWDPTDSGTPNNVPGISAHWVGP